MANPARRHILVVDDLPDIGDMMGAILNNLGYAATVAANGPAALVALSTTAFDGMITDVTLGDSMSGPELANLAMQRRPDLRIATLSGLLDESFYATGAIRLHLQKPVNHATLRRAMEALFAD